MSIRLEQVNEQLRSEIARLIEEQVELPDGLITVIYVDCSPDLRHARIGVSVLPEQLSGSALRELRRVGSGFTKMLRKKLNLYTIPRFHWEIDQGERHAAEMDDLIDQIRREEDKEYESNDDK